MIYTVANQKGGVAKTTTTLNLGAAFAEMGKRVLVVDFDPQCSLTLALGVHPYDVKQSIYHALREMPAAGMIDAVTRPTAIDGLFLVPATQDLARAEYELMAEYSREYFLKNVLAAGRSNYDYILVDCPPSLSILTTNALAAADAYIVPVTPDPMAVYGTDLLMSTVQRITRNVNRELKLAGILVTRFSSNVNIARQSLEEIQQAWSGRVLETVIKQSVKAQEAAGSGMSLLQYDTHGPLAEAYRQLARELTKTYVQQTTEI